MVKAVIMCIIPARKLYTAVIEQEKRFISHMAPKHPCGQETIDASKTRSEGGGTSWGRGARHTHKHIDRHVHRFSGR